MKGFRTGGFTIMELMLVLIVAAVLFSIALPSYEHVVRKARRTDALETLYRIQLAQEKWRSNNTAYGSLADLGVAATTPDGYYNISITLPVPPADQVSYTATATAVAGSSQVADSANGVSCSTLTINQNEPVYSPAGQSACWGK